ncbi:hypothetical protein [Streptomyces violaceusniger]|uniref:hypothetical protein n=1 Tax=Streptomyces violaceusniger TaxID=68280 RepID=UPI0002E03703|nr:hypothetical protein [Streptomyces violaceusniger]
MQSATVGVDHRETETCRKSAYLLGSIKWNTGKVTKKSIRVKSVTILYQGGRTAGLGGQSLRSEATNKTYWSNPYRLDPYKPDGPRYYTFKINKTIPATSKKPLQFQTNWSTAGKSGELPWCWGQSHFLYQLVPGRYSHG